MSAGKTRKHCKIPAFSNACRLAPEKTGVEEKLTGLEAGKRFRHRD